MTKHPRSVPLDEVLERLIRDRPQFGTAMVRQAVEEATDAEGRLVLRQVLRQVVKVRGVEAEAAAAAGLTPAALARTLSDRGSLKFDTVMALLPALGLQLVAVERPAAEPKPKRRRKPAGSAK